MNSNADARPPNNDTTAPTNANGVSHAPEGFAPYRQRQTKDPVTFDSLDDIDDVRSDEGVAISSEDGFGDVAASPFLVKSSPADTKRDEEEAAPASVPTPAPWVDVVHEALKGPEYGFSLSVAGLEKEARRLGREWADNGLPRHDLERDEAIEAEIVLAQRAGEIYAAWIRRVRQKVDAAIGNQRGLLDSALERGSRALESYQNAERTLQQLAPRSQGALPVPGGTEAPTPLDLPQSLEAVTTAPGPEHGAPPEETHPRTERIRLADREFGFSFWLLAIALVVAEFVANAPVFTELFPLSPEVEARATGELARSATSIYLYGLQDVAIRLAASPEPAILALVIVVFFLFLGHHVGGAARSLVALREPVSDVAPELLLRAKRQASWACLASFVGVGLMVVVLFLVRAQVSPMAEERLQVAERQVTAAEQNVANALDKGEDRERVDELHEAVYDAQDERARREARMDYATSINSANLPIAGMNVVLVIVAALAGYFRKELELPALLDGVPASFGPESSIAGAPDAAAVDSEQGVGHDDESSAPGGPAVPLEARVQQLRESICVNRQELGTALADGDRAHAAAWQLLHCNPTAKWEGMVKRLECAVPVFRSENAMARKLDPLDIKAFRRPPILHLAAPEERPLRLDLIEALDAAHERLRALRLAATTISLQARFADRAPESQGQEVIS